MFIQKFFSLSRVLKGPLAKTYVEGGRGER